MRHPRQPRHFRARRALGAVLCRTGRRAQLSRLVTHRLELGPGHRANLEAVARKARYDALRAANADAVALAHHGDDQAETVLLQLLRGAGPRGLAAMPRVQPGTPALWRPLLDLTRATLAGYAAARGVAWIDDESNADTQYARNLLRTRDRAPPGCRTFRAIPQRWRAPRNIKRRRASCSMRLPSKMPPARSCRRGLDCARLGALAPARARNLLRWFLREQGLRAPSEARLADMLRQLAEARADARTRIAHDGAEIGCHRGIVVVHAPSPDAFVRDWHGEAEVALPGGTLAFRPAQGSGMTAALLARLPVTLRSRAGGERMQVAVNRPRRAVKKLLQDAGVAAWTRQALPLVWCGDRLAAVPGVGIDLAFQAGPGESGWMVDWRPATPSRSSAD